MESGSVRALVNDHTYCAQSVEDYCLTALNVLFISEVDREEEEGKDQTNTGPLRERNGCSPPTLDEFVN